MKLFKRALISFAALIMLIGTAADAVSKPAAPAQRRPTLSNSTDSAQTSPGR